MQKQSPPIPVMCGSTTQRTATAATAASAAVPPARKVSIATRVASGCEVAAMPSQAMTGERPGRWKLRVTVKVSDLRPLGHVLAVNLGRAHLAGDAQPDCQPGDHVDEADHH